MKNRRRDAVILYPWMTHTLRFVPQAEVILPGPSLLSRFASWLSNAWRNWS